ncbi:MAG: hypothetical protein ACM3UZ_16870 [Acidobacteriota bacterium]
MGRLWAYVGIVFILGFLFFSLMAGGQEQGTYVSTNAVKLKADVSPSSVRLSGRSADDNLGFRGLDHQVQDDKMTVTVRYGSLCKSHPLNNFDITIKQDMQKINYIYFQGIENTDSKLVWQRDAVNGSNSSSSTNTFPSYPFEPEPPSTPGQHYQMN